MEIFLLRFLITAMNVLFENMTKQQKSNGKKVFPRRELNPGLLGESQVS